ncbi:ComEC/Rec2 family competence protein [Janibacter sp. G56]|uniref:ComEC/Rec2 family competence protein n=1 Tax=Janibacter sp. G56 TaxID=3418717 RepID=UPI003D00E484
MTRSRLDLRFMVPALAGWALTAATLSWSTGSRALLGVGLLATTSVAAFVLVRRARHGRADPGRMAWVVAVLATGALCAVASAGHDLARRAGPVDELAAGHSSVTARAIVLTEPIVRTQPGREDAVVMLRLRLTRVEARGSVTSTRAPVFVMADEAWAGLHWRDEITVRGRLAPDDPGSDTVATFRAAGPPEGRAPPGAARAFAENMRSGLREAVAGLPADARGLLPALVIGDTSQTPLDLEEDMRTTGMTHLAAVSGSNVAVILAAAVLAARGLGVRRWARPWFAMALLAWFVVLARPEPSVIRAATMGAIGLIGLSRSRRAAGLPVLAGAIVVLLLVDPWLARSFGFALSTLATLGLLVFVRPWGDAIAAHLPRRLRHLGPALALPVAAQLMCAPVVVLLQGSVSIIGVLANLLAAPLVPPSTVAGVGVALVALVSDRAAAVLAWAGGLPTLGIARIARTFADLPGGTLPWPDGAAGAWLLTAVSLLLVLAGRWLGHQVVTRTVTVCLIGLLVAGAAVPTRPLTWPPVGWRVVVCDVGQGDAIVLRSGPGRAVLVDVGPEPGPVDSCLDALDVSTLDAIVLSHFHADHVHGLAGALGGRVVRRVLVTPVADPAFQAKEVAHLLGVAGVEADSLVAGDRLALGEMSADVWWPARRLGEGSVPNNASLVLAASTGGADVLLLGDVEREAAHAIWLEARRDPRMAARIGTFDLVKTPHHGSANLDEDLMEAVAAPEAVISVGVDNDYGHPTVKHLDVVRRNGSRVWRTDRDGSVALVETAEGLGMVSEK